jgi:hypothetical protein
MKLEGPYFTMQHAVRHMQRSLVLGSRPKMGAMFTMESKKLKIA